MEEQNIEDYFNQERGIDLFDEELMHVDQEIEMVNQIDSQASNQDQEKDQSDIEQFTITNIEDNKDILRKDSDSLINMQTPPAKIREHKLAQSKVIPPFFEEKAVRVEGLNFSSDDSEIGLEDSYYNSNNLSSIDKAER